MYSSTCDENKSWDNERNHNPLQNSPIVTATIAITIATTAIMSINTKASILESLPLSRGLVFGNRIFFIFTVVLTRVIVPLGQLGGGGIGATLVVSGLVLSASRRRAAKFTTRAVTQSAGTLARFALVVNKRQPTSFK